MTRKRWSPQTDITPALIVGREKRKWQIAFRRYVIEQNPSPAYAPYFGLDIATLRAWIELQFSEGDTWGGFGKDWQFDHYIPLSYFDTGNSEDLRLSWHFLNMGVVGIREIKARRPGLDLITLKNYFNSILEATGIEICRRYLEKLDRIENSAPQSFQKQLEFTKRETAQIRLVAAYNEEQLELLNRGRTADEVAREIHSLKKPGISQ